MKATVTSILLFGLCMAGGAQAAFVQQNEAIPACDGTRVTQIGTGHPKAVTGYGDQLPLRMAIRLLLPEGWRAHIKPQVLAEPVSWQQGEYWTEAVTAAPVDVCYVIDWNTRTLYAGTDANVIKLAALEADDHALFEPRRGAPAETSRPGTGNGLWRLEPGSLRGQLQYWAKNAGMSLDWSGPDVPIHREYVVSGPLREAINEALVIANTRLAGEGERLQADFSHTPNLVITGVSTEPQPLPPAWSIHPGGLRIQLAAWAKQAGYQLVWNAKTDYDISAGATLYGSFNHVVTTLIDSLRGNRAAITAKIYAGNRTLVVSN